MTSKQLNEIWRKGDKLEMYPVVDTYIPHKENLALSYIHGTDDEYYDTNNDWYNAPTRIRYGQAGRDYNVFVSRCITFLNFSQYCTYPHNPFFLFIYKLCSPLSHRR